MLPPQLGPSCKPLSHREDQASRPCREAFPGGTGAGSLAGRGPLREEVLAEEWHVALGYAKCPAGHGEGTVPLLGPQTDYEGLEQSCLDSHK